MNPTETEAHEFYSLCRERDCRLTADEVRHWHDRILSLEKRLEAAERQLAMFVGSDLGAPVPPIAAGEEKP